MKEKINLLILSFAIVLSACSTYLGQGKTVLEQITPPAKPDVGTATVVGQVIEKKTGSPLGDVTVRLAEVHGEGKEGVFVLNHYSSPGARTDASGFFIFSKLQPGEYVVLVGEGENFNDYDVIEDSKAKKAIVWNAIVDQITDWGVIPAEVLFR